MANSEWRMCDRGLCSLPPYQVERSEDRPRRRGIEGGRSPRRNPVALLVAYACALSLLTGCHDPRYEESQAVRNQRIHSLFARIEPRHEKGINSIHELGNLHRELETHRRDHLDSTFDFVETREAERLDVWREGSNQHVWRTLFLGGHPDRIDDTYSKMFY